MRSVLILSLLLVAGFAFAQFGGTAGQKILDCQKDCCGLYGGTWDATDQVCELDYDSDEFYYYSDCTELCIEEVAQEEGWEDGAGDVVCCGSAFALLALLGFVAIRR